MRITKQQLQRDFSKNNAYKIRSTHLSIPLPEDMATASRSFGVKVKSWVVWVGLRSYTVKHNVRSPDFNDKVFKGLQTHFPCLEKSNAAARKGVVGMYGENITGYKTFKHNRPFEFKLGGLIPEVQIAYEEWGTLNSDRSNAILLHTGLSASSHAKSTKVHYLLYIMAMLQYYILQHAMGCNHIV